MKLKKNTKRILLVVLFLLIAVFSAILREYISWFGIPNILICVLCGTCISITLQKM